MPNTALSENSLSVLLLNISDETVELDKGSRIGAITKLGPCIENDTDLELEPPKDQTGLSDQISRYPKDIQELLIKYQRIFEPDSNLMHSTLAIKPVDLPAEKRLSEMPKTKNYRRQLTEEEDKYMQEFLKTHQMKGIIEPTTTPYASPTVLVKKRNGSYRFCVDSRKVNKYLLSSVNYPMPDRG